MPGLPGPETGPSPGPGPGPGLFNETHGIWSEMGPYGSVWAHIETGKSYMAQDRFQDTPDPQNFHGRTNNSKWIRDQNFAH
jgi:hypothetical protein